MMMSGMWWGFWLFPLFFFVVILGGFYMISRRNPAPPSNEGAALEILKRRYANGEINKEEFDQMKTDLLT